MPGDHMLNLFCESFATAANVSVVTQTERSRCNARRAELEAIRLASRSIAAAATSLDNGYATTRRLRGHDTINTRRRLQGRNGNGLTRQARAIAAIVTRERKEMDTTNRSVVAEPCCYWILPGISVCESERHQ